MDCRAVACGIRHGLQITCYKGRLVVTHMELFSFDFQKFACYMYFNIYKSFSPEGLDHPSGMRTINCKIVLQK